MWCLPQAKLLFSFLVNLCVHTHTHAHAVMNSVRESSLLSHTAHYVTRRS